MAGDAPFSLVKNKVLNILDKDKIHLVSNSIQKNTQDKQEIRWCQFEEMQRNISDNLRYLFTHLDFESVNATNKTLKAFKRLKRYLHRASGFGKFPPTSFLNDSSLDISINICSPINN